MPSPDGFAVLGIMRSVEATAEVPVLVLTALGDEEATRTAFDLGATDFLTKPFTMPQLAARVPGQPAPKRLRIVPATLAARLSALRPALAEVVRSCYSFWVPATPG